MAQAGVCWWCPSTSSGVRGGIPPRQGVQVLALSGSDRADMEQPPAYLEKVGHLRTDRIHSRRLEPSRRPRDDDLTCVPPFMSKLLVAGPHARAGDHGTLADLDSFRADRRSRRSDRW